MHDFGHFVMQYQNYGNTSGTGTVVNITKTCPCNTQRNFSTVKIENFVGIVLIFFLCLLKT